MFITCSKWVSDKAGEKEKKHLWILSCTVSNTISRANVSLVSVFCIDKLVITSPITSKYFTSIFSSTIPSSHPSLLLESRAFSISYPIEIIFPTNLFFANRVAILFFIYQFFHFLFLLLVPFPFAIYSLWIFEELLKEKKRGDKGWG